MKGGILTFILILLVVISLTAVVVSWAMMNMTEFFEMTEVNKVKNEFVECNDKIIETARAGLSNRCMFSADNGKIIATNNEISYQLISGTKLCDSSPWVLINPEKNLWQRCDVSGRENTFGLKLNYTSIKFQFEPIGNVEVRGQSGSIVEIGRADMNGNQMNLLLKVY